MQCRFLGDANDCFKWDYLHFVVQALGQSSLQIVWMMDPDDGEPAGYPPDRYPVYGSV